MELMINKVLLVWFLETNNILTNIQCDFRKNRSTIDAVSPLFFNLEKAYDTSWKMRYIERSL